MNRNYRANVHRPKDVVLFEAATTPFSAVRRDPAYYVKKLNDKTTVQGVNTIPKYVNK